MNDVTRIKMVNALTDYDRKQSVKRGYNPYALGHYFEALEYIGKCVDSGHSLEDAIWDAFTGPLLTVALKAAGIKKDKERRQYHICRRLLQDDD